MPPDSLTPPSIDASERAPDALWRSRYRGDDLPPDAPWNPVLATLMAHRSVRAFLPDPVSPDALTRIIAAAQSAATSSNLQTWSVIAVEDTARKARLAVLAAGQKHIVEAPLFLVWLADLARLGQIAAQAGIELEAVHYLEALLLGVVDAALAAQNATVALESMNLGTVYIGAMRNKPEEVAAELGLPPHVFAVFGMCIGTPDPARPAAIKPRLPQAAVLHREQYNASAQLAAVADYAARLGTFQREQAMAEEDWARRCIARMRAPASLTGRDRMSEALGNLGFRLR